ncbi:MAG: TetR/AcrR family transcriptional regulator [Chloroflexota bacterium]|nr:TetR/AcrR family transcriptional regulator [Chloroflexota bacterium]
MVLAAYERIAAEGFEGLRTRDVAADVGVNVATLHYYFPTKEALIRAVVGYAMSRFVATIPTEGSGSAVLRGHLQGLARLIKEDRQLWAVLGELTLRAPRDPDLGQILGKTDQTWQAKLAEMLRSAAAGAGLTPGLNADDAAAVIVATIKGLALPTLSGSDPGRVDRVFGQLLNWVGLQDQITQ